MKELLIEQASSLIVSIALALLSLLSTWLTVKLSRHIKLKNVTDALNTCLEMTRVTVGELQQKFVDDMKSANEDGKLTYDEIKQLNTSLIVYTKNKLTPSIIKVIEQAGISINQFILDAGENYVQELKHE